jgi:hypothetical protein
MPLGISPGPDATEIQSNLHLEYTDGGGTEQDTWLITAQ